MEDGSTRQINKRNYDGYRPTIQCCCLHSPFSLCYEEQIQKEAVIPRSVEELGRKIALSSLVMKYAELLPVAK